MQQKISFVIPIYNEVENIGELYSRLKRVATTDFEFLSHEIIFIDDGSTDDSFEKVVEFQSHDDTIKVFQFSRNFGHHIALTAGLDMAQGDYVVMMDGDLQDQPEEIIKLYQKLQEGYDVVYGNRAKKQFGPIKKFFSAIFNFIMYRLINESIVINSTIFRIMTKQVVENIRKLHEQDRYIIGIIGWVGFKHAAQEVAHGKRYKGISKYNLSAQFALAFDAIISFSNYPLKIIIKIGLLIVLASFLVSVSIIYKKFVFGTPVIGWSSLIVSILLIGGIEISTLGIIGEYLGRNYMQNKNRPLYIIKKQLP